MTHPKSVRLFLVVAFLTSRVASAQTSTSPVLTASQLFEKASPSVVKIIVMDEDDQPIGIGSGFVVDRKTLRGMRGGEGFTYVVTNHHVIRAGVSARVEFASVAIQPGLARKPPTTPLDEPYLPRGYVLNVVVEDEHSDLAVLCVWPTHEPDPALDCCDDPLPPVGTPVLVISSPEGLQNTLSDGLVSGYLEHEKGAKWIQITAPVGPGSSGGPVLTADGKVIGVTVGTLPDAQNANFAVPVEALTHMLKGKYSHRSLWEGTSYTEERKYEFGRAKVALGDEYAKVRDETGGNKPGPSYREFISSKAAAGDQLALLMIGVDEFDEHGSSTEASILHLTAATTANLGKFAYLAHYYLGHAYYWSGPLWGSGPKSLEKRKHFLEQSFEPLKKAISLAPKFSASHYLLACGYKDTERYPDALVAATNLIALVPRCSEAYQIRGQILAELGSRQGFEADFKVAFELRPNNGEAFANMAFGYTALKDWGAAIEANKRALAAGDRQSDSWKGATWGNLAINYMRNDDCRNALPAFEKFRALVGLQHPFEEYCRQQLKK